MAIANDRDRQIVLAVGRFRQLAAGHIQSLFFADANSRTSCHRALQRLYQRKYLVRIERRIVGGSGAGSGQYVYALGQLGWRDVCRRTGKFQPQRTIHLHDLGIADAYVAIKQLEHSAALRVVGLSTEPDSWLKVEGTELRPDLHVEIQRPGSDQTRQWWLEIDTGSEGQAQLKEKMLGYYKAHDVTGQYEEEDAQGNVVTSWVGPRAFPRIVFIVPDVERMTEIKWLISRGPDDAAQLFDVVLGAEFSTWAVDKLQDS
jgi:hypothetical protein